MPYGYRLLSEPQIFKPMVYLLLYFVMEPCGDPQSQMQMPMHHHIQQGVMNMNMHMVSQGMPMQVGMIPGNNERKSPHDAHLTPAPTNKKRKKPSPRNQSTAAAVARNMNDASVIMGPNGAPMGTSNVNMMMGRDGSATIVAQNPFDDFPDPISMQQQQNNARMQQQPPTPHFAQGMPQHPQQLQGGPQQMAFDQQMMQNHGPNVSVQQMQHQIQMRNMGGLPPGYQQQPGSLPDTSGRTVYPASETMIFNHQNRNAPPIYPCGQCHKEVHENEQAIFCESGCNFWFHRTCTGLTETSYNFMVSEVYAEWACEECIRKREVPLVKIKP